MLQEEYLTPIILERNFNFEPKKKLLPILNEQFKSAAENDNEQCSHNVLASNIMKTKTFHLMVMDPKNSSL